MKKSFVVIGTFALIIGILLTALPFLIYVPKTIIQAYQVPQSTVLVHISVPQFASSDQPVSNVTERIPLNGEDRVNIQVNVTSVHGVDLSVNDGSTTYLSYSNIITVNENWTVPKSLDYNFVFNSSNTFTSKDVTWQVTKHWTETAYRDVTTNNQLLPFEFAYLSSSCFSWSGLNNLWHTQRGKGKKRNAK